MTPIQLVLHTGYGLCDLTLVSGARSIQASATFLEDALSNLLLAVTDLSTGRQCVACRWGDEPGGVLIDIARNGAASVGIAVSRMARPTWYGDVPGWVPARGTLLWEATTETEQFFEAFRGEVRRLVALPLSDEGGPEGWPWPLPKEAVRLFS